VKTACRFVSEAFGGGYAVGADAAAAMTPLGHQPGDLGMRRTLEDVHPDDMEPADHPTSGLGHEHPTIATRPDRRETRRDVAGGCRVPELARERRDGLRIRFAGVPDQRSH
jgi:hypothetical protein